MKIAWEKNKIRETIIIFSKNEFLWLVNCDLSFHAIRRGVTISIPEKSPIAHVFQTISIALIDTIELDHKVKVPIALPTIDIETEIKMNLIKSAIFIFVRVVFDQQFCRKILQSHQIIIKLGLIQRQG